MATATLPALTPSRVKDTACPKLFLAKHITRTIPPEPWKRHLAHGNGIHETFRYTYDPTVTAAPAERDIERLARRAYGRQRYSDHAMREEDIQRAIAVVTSYVATDPDVNHTICVETDETFVAGRGTPYPITFKARMDRRIVRPSEPGTLRIIDYKTGAPGEIDIDAATITLAVARVVFDKTLYPELILEYHFVSEEGIVDRALVAPNEVRQYWPELLARGQRLYYSGDYPANPGPQCDFCPLKPACRPVTNIDMNGLDGLFDNE